jgi:hypothetical protein
MSAQAHAGEETIQVLDADSDLSCFAPTLNCMITVCALRPTDTGGVLNADTEIPKKRKKEKPEKGKKIRAGRTQS